jgi:soluble cytochrome b562
MDSFSYDESAWSLPSTAWSSPGRLAAWPQPKNFVARPSVKSLIEHSCSSTTQPPAPLDAVFLLIHERGLKEVAEAKEKAKPSAALTKLEAELVEAENAIKKNKWSKVDDKKAYAERLRREIQEAKNKQSIAAEHLAAVEKRYASINSVVEEHAKIVEIHERYMKNRAEYYGLA